MNKIGILMLMIIMIVNYESAQSRNLAEVDISGIPNIEAMKDSLFAEYYIGFVENEYLYPKDPGFELTIRSYVDDTHKKGLKYQFMGTEERDVTYDFVYKNRIPIGYCTINDSVFKDVYLFVYSDRDCYMKIKDMIKVVGPKIKFKIASVGVCTFDPFVMNFYQMDNVLVGMDFFLWACNPPAPETGVCMTLNHMSTHCLALKKVDS